MTLLPPLLFAVGLQLSTARAMAPLHWAALPPLPAPAYDISPIPGGVAALLADGRVLGWDGRAWVERAAAAPDGVSFGNFVCGGEGRCWAVRCEPGAVRELDLAQGRWGPITALPDSCVDEVKVGPDGRPWASGLHGALWVLREEGWLRIPGMDGHVRTVPLDADRAWALSSDGLIALVDASGALQPVTETEGGNLELQIAEDTNGSLLLSGGSLRRRVADRWETLLPIPVREISAGSQGWVALSEDRSWIHRPDGDLDLPLPAAEPLGLVTDEGGSTWAVGGGRVYSLRPGGAPAFREVADRWGVAALAEGERAWATDLDGDGRSDLLIGDDHGPLRLLLQGEQGFSEGAASVGLDLPGRPLDLAFCDLDGNGHLDLLAALPGASESSGSLRYLRNHGGWLEDVTRESGMDPPPAPGAVTRGRWSCADIDGDDDLDVALAAGPAAGLVDRGIAIFENIGQGRLRALPLPEGPLGGSRGWPHQLLAGRLDADPFIDLVLVHWWGAGHQRLLGRGPWRFAESTEGSGLAGVYAADRQSWLQDIDGDDVLDLLTMGEVWRLWRGRRDGSFDDITEASGLAYVWMPGQGALGDLDGDGLPELVTCEEAGCRILQSRSAGGFTELPGLLAPSTDQASGLSLFDLGRDGDLDLLILRPGPDRLFENLGSGQALPPAPASSMSAALLRRLVWARAFPDGLLSLALLALVLGARGFLHRRGAAERLGGRPGAWLSGAGALLLPTALLERPPEQRLLLVGLVAALLLVGTRLELGASQRRRSLRVGGFRLLGRIGRGAMGTVYSARDEQSGESVAVKLIDPTLLSSEADHRLFQQEARMGAAVRDPHVVRLRSWGSWTPTEGGQPVAYLVMDLIAGRTLQDLLQERGPLPVGLACHFGQQLAMALQALHQARVVHRDVKPANLMIVEGGGLVLMDLGAARPVGSVTRSVRQVLGTLRYMAPEQARGRPPEPRSDLYAAGVVLYEMLVGEPLHPVDDLPALFDRFGEPPPSLCARREEVPPELDALCRALLDPEPAGRPASAGEVALALASHAHLSAPLHIQPRPAAALLDPGTPSGGLSLLSLLGRYARFRRERPQGTLADFAVWLQPDGPPSMEARRRSEAPKATETWEDDR